MLLKENFLRLLRNLSQLLLIVHRNHTLPHSTPPLTGPIEGLATALRYQVDIYIHQGNLG